MYLLRDCFLHSSGPPAADFLFAGWLPPPPTCPVARTLNDGPHLPRGLWAWSGQWVLKGGLLVMIGGLCGVMVGLWV